MTNQQIFKLSWTISKLACQVFSGKPSDFFAESVKEVHTALSAGGDEAVSILVYSISSSLPAKPAKKLNKTEQAVAAYLEICENLEEGYLHLPKNLYDACKGLGPAIYGRAKRVLENEHYVEFEKTQKENALSFYYEIEREAGCRLQSGDGISTLKYMIKISGDAVKTAKMQEILKSVTAHCEEIYV